MCLLHSWLKQILNKRISSKLVKNSYLDSADVPDVSQKAIKAKLQLQAVDHFLGASCIIRSS